jgi:hypothetical protein
MLRLLVCLFLAVSVSGRVCAQTPEPACGSRPDGWDYERVGLALRSVALHAPNPLNRPSAGATIVLRQRSRTDGTLLACPRYMQGGMMWRPSAVCSANAYSGCVEHSASGFIANGEVDVRGQLLGGLADSGLYDVELQGTAYDAQGYSYAIIQLIPGFVFNAPSNHVEIFVSKGVIGPNEFDAGLYSASGTWCPNGVDANGNARGDSIVTNAKQVVSASGSNTWACIIPRSMTVGRYYEVVVSAPGYVSTTVTVYPAPDFVNKFSVILYPDQLGSVSGTSNPPHRLNTEPEGAGGPTGTTTEPASGGGSGGGSGTYTGPSSDSSFFTAQWWTDLLTAAFVPSAQSKAAWQSSFDKLINWGPVGVLRDVSAQWSAAAVPGAAGDDPIIALPDMFHLAPEQEGSSNIGESRQWVIDLRSNESDPSIGSLPGRLLAHGRAWAGRLLWMGYLFSLVRRFWPRYVV